MPYLNHADLGGQAGFGAVTPEPEGELFHADWEPRALAISLAMGATGAWNIDQSRAARETLPDYLQLSYYQIWLAGLQRLLAERALAMADELAAGQLLHPAKALPRKLLADAVPGVLAKGSATLRSVAEPARFAQGDAVRSSDAPTPHHSRLPAYARGKTGRVLRVHGAHVFADSHAQGLGEAPQWLYAVVFDGRTLWGADADPGLSVTLDIWQRNLDPA